MTGHSRRPWPLLILIAACGYITSTSPDSSLSVTFYGFTPTLLPVAVELQVQTEHRSYLWTGGLTASETRPQAFSPIGLVGNDSLRAVAILRTPQGGELARVVTELRVKSRYLYGLGFQAGGTNPDSRDFCHLPPSKVAIPGFPGDTLFLWASGLPEGAIC